MEMGNNLKTLAMHRKFNFPSLEIDADVGTRA